VRPNRRRLDNVGFIGFDHIGFRDATREDFSALADWLLARALEHDKPSLLFQLACEHLHAEKIIRPG